MSKEGLTPLWSQKGRRCRWEDDAEGQRDFVKGMLSRRPEQSMSYPPRAEDAGI